MRKMKKLVTLLLTLAALLALAAPAAAFDMGEMGGANTLSLNFFTTAAIDKDGSLWMWGTNWAGHLGNGGEGNFVDSDGTTCQTVPVKIMDQVLSVSAGWAHTAAIKTDHSLWMWGSNEFGQVGNDREGNGEDSTGEPIQDVPVKVMDDVVAVSAGTCHTAAIKTDGSLWTWGDNTCGQLGNGGEGDWSTTYKKYPDAKCPFQSSPVKVMDDVVAVSAGRSTTAAIKTDGSLWMWGANWDGQLGNGGKGDAKDPDGRVYQTVPVKVMDDVLTVSAGNDFTAAIKNDGSLWVWGDNSGGELGNGGGGNQTNKALASDAFYWIWSNSIQDDDEMETEYSCQTVPLKIMDNVAAVSAGESSMAAIKSDGSLWMWGEGMYVGNRALHDGSGMDIPEEIYSTPHKTNDGVISVSCGSDGAAVLKKDGTLQLWGLNSSGVIGNGTTTASATPVPLQGLNVKKPTSLRDFKDISLNSWYTPAVRWAAAQGIASGTSGTTFSPGEPCTKAQILSFLWRANGSPEPTIANPYADMKGNAWYEKAARWAYEKGLVANGTLSLYSSSKKGITITLPTLTPDSPCTRGDVVTYLWKLNGSPEPKKTSSFADVPADANYAQAVSWAVEQGIASGTGDTTFSPKQACTRAQIMVFLYRDLQK